MHEILLPKSRLIRRANAYRHPEQARFAARLPLAGRRVPLRGLWRGYGRASRNVRAVAPLFARTATGTLRPLATEAGHASMAAASVAARGGRFTLRRPLPMLLLGLAGGALAMFYLDANSGRRRRALVRDRFAHMGKVVTRRVPRTVEKRGRFLRGVARGVTHDAGRLIHNGNHPTVDDETLVARVRSEVLRGRGIHAGDIVIDAYEGCVTLRGQLQDRHDIDELVRATHRVDGVREVRSYLHLPGTPPPNKALSTGVPEHMRF